MALTRDLQAVLDQITAFFEAHPEQLQPNTLTTISVISRRAGNTREGAMEIIPTFRRFRDLAQFSSQHGPFQGPNGGNPRPPVEVYIPPKPAIVAPPAPPVQPAAPVSP